MCISSQEELELALKNNNKPYLLGVKHGMLVILLDGSVRLAHEYWIIYSSQQLCIIFLTFCLFFAGCVCVCLAPRVSVCDQIRAVCQAICLSSLLSSAENEAPEQLLKLKSPSKSYSHIHA